MNKHYRDPNQCMFQYCTFAGSGFRGVSTWFVYQARLLPHPANLLGLRNVYDTRMTSEQLLQTLKSERPPHAIMGVTDDVLAALGHLEAVRTNSFFEVDLPAGSRRIWFASSGIGGRQLTLVEADRRPHHIPGFLSPEVEDRLRKAQARVKQLAGEEADLERARQAIDQSLTIGQPVSDELRQAVTVAVGDAISGTVQPPAAVHVFRCGARRLAIVSTLFELSEPA